jgi:hypothetical protein
MGVSIGTAPAPGGVQRYRVIVAFVLTAIFVAIKAIGQDFWSVGFGLALLGVILLTPQPEQQTEPWRAHALRVVSACFVVVTLCSVVATLADVAR